jgi:hypothetical protein
VVLEVLGILTVLLVQSTIATYFEPVPGTKTSRSCLPFMYRPWLTRVSWVLAELKRLAQIAFVPGCWQTQSQISALIEEMVVMKMMARAERTLLKMC